MGEVAHCTKIAITTSLFSSVTPSGNGTKKQKINSFLSYFFFFSFFTKKRGLRKVSRPFDRFQTFSFFFFFFFLFFYPFVEKEKKKRRELYSPGLEMDVEPILQYPMRVKSERNPKPIKTVVHDGK
jgi:hypothetical protein